MLYFLLPLEATWSHGSPNCKGVWEIESSHIGKEGEKACGQTAVSALPLHINRAGKGKGGKADSSLWPQFPPS